MIDKPYRQIPIRECGELLRPLPPELFHLPDPPPYIALGAGPAYGAASPWMLRETVLFALIDAQKRIQATRPGWRFKIHDAYRPNAVQAFMVDLTFRDYAKKAGYQPDNLTEDQKKTLAPSVFSLWAFPSDDPATPPPHSTGAALDITLIDENGVEIDMGGPVDDDSGAQKPDFWADSESIRGQKAHQNRLFLRDSMQKSGFWRHPNEWWHFSLGDQLASWIEAGGNLTKARPARYGRADLLEL